MQPAFFKDGQSLSSIHFHIDACFWKGDEIIDGTTFLVPSKFPMVGLEFYTVGLDELTGIHHVTLRKMSLRTILSLTDPSKSEFSSHIAEFANGRIKAVPRANFTAPGSEQKTRMCEKEDTVEPVRDPLGDNLPCFADRPVSTSQNGIPTEAYATPVVLASSVSRSALVSGSGSPFRKLSPDVTVNQSCALDDSIIGSGHVVGQRAADNQSSLSNFPISIYHIVPRSVTFPTSINADGPDAAAPVLKPVEVAIKKEAFTTATSPRRPSNGGQGDKCATSTVPTSPSSSTSSTLPYCCTMKALALEEPPKHESGKINDVDSVVRRRSWDLAYSIRQLKHWDEIQERSRSPALGFVPAPTSGLSITEEGRIIMVVNISNDSKASLTLPQITSKSVEAGGCDYAYTDAPETEVKEQCPNVDWGFRECAELFNAASTKKLMIVNPEYDNRITKLLGRGTLAQTFMSGQGFIPRTTSRMETILGRNAVEMMMKGHGIPRATRGMVTLLGTGNVPQTQSASQDPGVGAIVPSSDLANNDVSGRSTPSCSTEFTETPESPMVSGHKALPTKMRSSSMNQLQTLGLSPIQENPQSPAQKHKTPTSTKPSWNPNFTRVRDQSSFPARKQAASLPMRVAAKPLPATSSKSHSRKTSSDSETIWTENNSTHTRNTSVSENSSSSETLFTENGSTHTRNTSLSEAMSLEECKKAEETVNGTPNPVRGSREEALSLVLVHVLEQFAEEKLDGTQNPMRFYASR